MFRDLGWLLRGAVLVAFLRVLLTVFYFRQEFRGGFTPDRALFKRQLAYALPFAAAVLVEIVQASLPQYAVSYLFDPATFAIFAVGCLQIPLVEFAASPTSDVMMVKMQERLAEGRKPACARNLARHDLETGPAVLSPGGILRGGGTADHRPPVHYQVPRQHSHLHCRGPPMSLLSTFQVDGVMRVFAQTRFLLVLNVMRLVMIAGLLKWSLSEFHLLGPVLVIILATAAFKAGALIRMKRLLEIRTAQLLPWRSLAALLAASAGAGAVAWAVKVADARCHGPPAVRDGACPRHRVHRFGLELRSAQQRRKTGADRVDQEAAVGSSRAVRLRERIKVHLHVRNRRHHEFWTANPSSNRNCADMCSAIAHRGPDDEGFYLAPGVGLGMRRLSIIDLDSGRQPVSNEDGSVWVVFNGEIYNFQELRREMEGRGHVFSTHSDTETIVHLYEEYGKRCVDHLRGMFAFALWDARRRQLLIARDRLGIKPLYYAEIGGRILFASELKSILQLPEVERTLNWSAVSHLFSFLSTPPTEAIIDGVHKLEPGHILTVSPGRAPVVERYWDLRFEPDYGREEGYFVDRCARASRGVGPPAYGERRPRWRVSEWRH